jgi:hypothetical protein
VITWLSTVCPAVGLTLSPQYAEITSAEWECKHYKGDLFYLFCK